MGKSTNILPPVIRFFIRWSQRLVATTIRRAPRSGRGARTARAIRRYQSRGILLHRGVSCYSEPGFHSGERRGLIRLWPPLAMHAVTESRVTESRAFAGAAMRAMHGFFSHGTPVYEPIVPWPDVQVNNLFRSCINSIVFMENVQFAIRYPRLVSPSSSSSSSSSGGPSWQAYSWSPPGYSGDRSGSYHRRLRDSY